MHVTPIAAALSLALASLAVASADQTSVASPLPATRETRPLAEKLVLVTDARASTARALEPLETVLSAQIATGLSRTGPSVTARVKQIVHDAFAPVEERADRVLAEGYAANFSAQELGQIIAFEQGPGGQTDRENQPLLKKELAAALRESKGAAKAEATAEQAFAAASPTKRALVQRILKAQNFEGQTRRGYAALRAVMASRGGSAVPTTGSGAAAEARAADAYVNLATAVTKGFYAIHYSDAQLDDLATYLESEPGQAVVTRLPRVTESAGDVLVEGLSDIVTSLPERVCAAMACSPDQRANLDGWAAVMATRVSTLAGLPNLPG